MKVGIAGFGTIGKVIGRALDNGIDGLELEAVCSGDRAKAAANMKDYKRPVDAEPALKAGKVLVTVSGAGILVHPEVIDLAKEHGGRLILATGALLGLDAVRAAAEGTIHEVRMITRKPPNALIGAPHLVENNISVEGLNEPKKVFEGTAREGAAGFPANVNVAAALGMAGIGPDATKLEIWADPTLDRNTHTIRVDADSARFELTIENVQSEENPGTGKITALSVIACLRGLASPFKVGS